MKQNIEFRKELGLGIGNDFKVALGYEYYDEFTSDETDIMIKVKSSANKQNIYIDKYKNGEVNFVNTILQHPDNMYDKIATNAGIDLDKKENVTVRFKKLIVLYYTAKFYENVVNNIDYSPAEQKQFLEEMKNIKYDINAKK